MTRDDVVGTLMIESWFYVKTLASYNFGRYVIIYIIYKLIYNILSKTIIHSYIYSSCIQSA